MTSVQLLPSAAPPRHPGQLRPADLGDLLGVPFTDEQLRAATAPLEPGVIVAGAGSGKTTVMAARVVWLVATGQVAAEQVLGLTFTNKAASELASRVRSSLAAWAARSEGGRSGTEFAEGTDAADGAKGADGEPTVLTYHAYAGRLVAEHGLRIGVEPQSRLLADASRFQLAARAVRRAPGPFRLLTKTLDNLVADVVGLDAQLAEHLVDPAELRAHDEALIGRLTSLPKTTGAVSDVAQAARMRLELLVLVEAFRAEKRRLDVLDFGDQVQLGARLAQERPETGTVERSRFLVVLLDEYQDTSVAQRRMLAGLFGGGHPVTAVGDPCQGIYGWRGASVTNLDHFPDHFPRRDTQPAATYALTQNQRSGGRLLRLANTVASALRDVHRGVAELTPRADVVHAGSTTVALLPTYGEEIDWMAEQIVAALAAGTPAGEIAVLVRVRSDFAAVHAALVERDVPVEVVGLGGLLALPEVADVVAMLQVLDDPTCNAALVRLLCGPRWRIGPRDLAELGRQARHLVGAVGAMAGDAGDRGNDAGGQDSDSGLRRAVRGTDSSEAIALADALARPDVGSYSAPARARFAACSAELRELRRHFDEPLLDIISRIALTTGLDVELAARPGAGLEDGRDALSTFLDEAAQFVDLEGESSVTAFLSYLRAAELYERGLDSTSPGGREAVQVMTVHKAKGLEWDVVAVPDLVARVFPSNRGIDRWTTCSQALPHPLRGDFADLPAVVEWSPKGLKRFTADCQAATELEERRLGYVAFTRARNSLIASGHWWGIEQKLPRGPSIFLQELHTHCAAGLGTVAHWAPEPTERTNPNRLSPRQYRWPSELAPSGWQRRRQAAVAVRRGIDELAAGRLPLFVDDSLTAAEAALVADWDADAEVLMAEAAAEPDARRLIALPPTLTASRLVRLHRDPAGLARELARPMPRRPVPAARQGTRFHAWVESLFVQRPLLDPDDLPGAGDDDLGPDADLVSLQAAFLRTPYAGRQPVAVEAPFELLLAGRVVRGRIDAVYAAGDGFEVVDWKTGTEPADPLQLAIYRLAWAELAGLPVEAVGAAFLYVRTGEILRPAGLPDRVGLTVVLTGGAPDGLALRGPQ